MQRFYLFVYGYAQFFDTVIAWDFNSKLYNTFKVK